MVKAIIFDCWDTLFYDKVKPHPFSAFAERIGYSLQDYKFLKIFEKHFMLEKHYNRTVPIKNILTDLKINPSKERLGELKQILDKLPNHARAFPEVLEVLNQLKKEYKLGLISNTDYMSFERLQRDFKLKDIFDVMLKSYETGILKPDPRIFKLMIDKLEVKKNEALMVGDSLEDDVKATEEFGIKGILIDRKNKHSNYSNRITSLDQLYQFL